MSTQEKGHVSVSGVRGQGDGLCTLPLYCCQPVWNDGSVSMWANLLRKGLGVFET